MAHRSEQSRGRGLSRDSFEIQRGEPVLGRIAPCPGPCGSPSRTGHNPLVPRIHRGDGLCFQALRVSVGSPRVAVGGREKGNRERRRAGGLVRRPKAADAVFEGASVEGHEPLTLEGEPAQSRLTASARLVSGFEQARSQVTVHLDEGADDLLGPIPIPPSPLLSLFHTLPSAAALNSLLGTHARIARSIGTSRPPMPESSFAGSTLRFRRI